MDICLKKRCIKIGKRIIDKYTDEELLVRLKVSTSFQAFIESLGYTTGRSANVRRVVIRRLNEAGINHKDYLNPKTFNATLKNRIPDELFYVKGKYRGNVVARRLKKDGFIPYICLKCENTGNWQGKSLSLQIDHIDGNNKNNELSNLRWLCPNCHTQTATYGSKNKYRNVA